MRQELLKQLTPQDIDEIFDVTRSLKDIIPTAHDVLHALLEMNRCPPTVGERFPFVLACAELAVGRKLGKERCEDNTLIRSFVSYKLRMEGYTYNDIGRMLQRDHSTVTHLFNKMSDILSVPNAYRKEIERWKEFVRLLD